MDNNSWYISKFCLSWKTLAGISPSFVCHGQYYLVHIPVLSVMNKNDWYITWFFLSLIINVVISPHFSVVGKIGWYINWICLSWSIMVGLSTGFVCHGQYWLIYHQVYFCRGQYWL